MAAVENMDSFEARLATYQNIQTAGRKRASTTKGGKGGKWTLKSPSSEQLAQAGFYFAPTGPGSDNVTCFSCEKSLDGWEEGDNAFSEHLHFSGDCAWALLMAIENDVDEELKLENPMSDRMIEARRQTYKDQWPHEKKRGWTCKIQKMVEGGWYFSPSPEGDDQANCVYCKKSLWGWEPKDKPFDEHQKRSPDCVFFTGSQIKPVTKGRKSRVSKSSRVSNQSTATINTDEPEQHVPEVDETQASLITVDMSMASTTSKAKKGARTKKANTKSSRSKAVPAPTEVVEDIVETVSKPSTRATRGKKRTSDAMLEDSIQAIEPPKKRATRARDSTINPTSQEMSVTLPDVTMEAADLSPVISKKGGKTGRKRASTATRKPSKRIASNQSTASEAPLRLAVPTNDEIDAALQADLERFESDDDSDNWRVLGKDDSVVSQVHVPTTTRTSIIKPSMTRTRGKTNTSVIEDRSVDIIMEEAPRESVSAVIAVKNCKSKPGRKPKKAASITVELEPQRFEDMDIKEFEESLEAEDQQYLGSDTQDKQPPLVSQKDVANVSQATIADDSGHETDGSILAHNKAKRESKKGKGSVKTKQTTRKASAKQKIQKKNKGAETAFQVPVEVQDDDVAEELELLQKQHLVQQSPADLSKKPTKHVDVALDLIEAPKPKSPLPAQEQMRSPEPSPQASDAENQPPSSRPSQTRPPLARYSPTGARTVRIALAPSTPTGSPSKQNARLETTYPWAPADIDYILTGTPAVNRENIDLSNLLSSEEKRMTLEQWINWNAKKNEDRLKAECERMVGKFESEGVRALKTLEGIVCSDS